MAASQILQDVYGAHVDHFGEPNDSWVFDDGKRSDIYPNRIDVLVWGATTDCDITTFSTIGMSDREMLGAEHRAELHFAVRLTLPEEDRVAIARFLANLAMYPFQIGSFLDWWHIIADPGKIPLYSCAHCVLLHPRFVQSGWDTIQTAEGEVHILNVIPITREERALKEKARIADALSSVDMFSPR